MEPINQIDNAPQKEGSRLLVANFPGPREAKAAYKELASLFSLHRKQRIDSMMGDYDSELRTQAQLNFTQKNDITWKYGELYHGGYDNYEYQTLGLYQNQIGVYHGYCLAMPEIEEYLEKTSGNKIRKSRSHPSISVTVPMDESAELQELYAEINKIKHFRRNFIPFRSPWSNKTEDPIANHEVVLYRDPERMFFWLPVEFEELEQCIEFLNSYTGGKHELAFCNKQRALELEPLNILKKYCPDCRAPALRYLADDENKNQMGHAFCKNCGGMYTLKALAHLAGLSFSPGSKLEYIDGQGKTIMTMDAEGRIYSVTEDKTLTQLYKDEEDAFFEFYVLSESVALATRYDNYLIRTRDGGESWEKLNPPQNEESGIMNAAPSGALYSIGHDYTLESRDGAETWQELHNPDPDLLYIYTRDNLTIFQLGPQRALLRSDNSGLTWSKIEINTDAHLFKMLMFDDESGILIGGESTFLQTRDAGLTWEHMHIKSPGKFQSFKLSPEGFACALKLGGQLVLFDDKGETHQKLEIDFSRQLNDFHPMPGRKLLLVGEDGVLLEYQLPEYE